MVLKMRDWKPYPRNRKIFYEDGYALIVPENFEQHKNSMPLFCEVCGFRFASKQDERTYEKFKCCSSCADAWAYSNKDKWEAGWRPSQEQIKPVIEKRSIVNPDLVFE